jgi:hypothetical protein
MLTSALGYLIFAVVMVALMAALTAYYVLRGRKIGWTWWRRAEQENKTQR